MDKLFGQIIITKEKTPTIIIFTVKSVFDNLTISGTGDSLVTAINDMTKGLVLLDIANQEL